MSEFVLLYITNPNKDTARKIAQQLLEKRLIACANLFPVSSMYWWQGKVEADDEVVIIAKTRSELFSEIEETVRESHPYTCPCIVAFPIAKGNSDFLDWISTETRKN